MSTQPKPPSATEVNLDAGIVAKVNDVMHRGFEIPLESLRPEANVFSDLGLDSLDAIDMLVHLEEQLHIKVDGERLMNVQTMQDIYLLVSEVIASRPAD